MLKTLHIPEPLAGAPLAPWFAPVPKNALFKEHMPPNFFDTVPRAAPEAAAAIVLPNNFTKTPDAAAEAYIGRYLELGARLGIPVYAFSLGDFTDTVRFDPRLRVFRLSTYRSTLALQDVVMPTLTEDLGRSGIVLREKRERPVVSFCGMAGFPSAKAWIKYCVKNMLLPPARRIGVYWRRAAMRACGDSPLLETNFIVRKSFSGDRRTVELDPAQARRDFIASIVEADFVLAPKGDGNYSNRFLEALSLGRIPVLIDTEAVLPFEDRIDYAQVIVRVPMREVRKMPQYVRAWYDALTPEEWQERQRLARETFDRYLRQDSFFFEYFNARVL